MVSQGKLISLSVNTLWDSSHLIYSKCKGHHAGQKCRGFQWLSDPLDQWQLKELKRLWVLHDLLGSKYGQTSPSDHLIMEVLSSEYGSPSPTPVIANLPTPPQTQTSPIRNVAHQIRSPSPLAGPSKQKRRRSPSPKSLSIIPFKRARLHGSRLSSSQASSSKVHCKIIDLSVDNDEEQEVTIGKGKGRAKERFKQSVWMVSLGDDHFELFDSDEDSKST